MLVTGNLENEANRSKKGISVRKRPIKSLIWSEIARFWSVFCLICV